MSLSSKISTLKVYNLQSLVKSNFVRKYLGKVETEMIIHQSLLLIHWNETKTMVL